jgi:hypothetical protein
MRNLRSLKGAEPVGHPRRSAQFENSMSNTTITYVVGASLGVFGLAAFCGLVLVPAITAYRRPLERVAVVVLSLYVLAALIGVGVLLGALIVFEWPRVF